MANIKRVFILLIGLILLSACTHHVDNRIFIVNPKQYPDEMKQAQAPFIIRNLQKQGVNVVQIGDTMRILLPSDLVFNPASANINGRGAGILNNVAYLMKLLETTSAQVAGYTDVSPVWQVDQALSARQAEVVANYLWDRGVDSRILYAVGYGASSPLSLNPSEPGNRRVEIRFQYIHFGIGRL